MADQLDEDQPLAQAQQLVNDNEDIQTTAAGTFDHDSGLLVLTDRRLIFMARGELRWSVLRSAVDDARWLPDDPGSLTISMRGRELRVTHVPIAEGHHVARELRSG